MLNFSGSYRKEKDIHDVNHSYKLGEAGTISAERLLRSGN